MDSLLAAFRAKFSSPDVLLPAIDNSISQHDFEALSVYYKSADQAVQTPLEIVGYLQGLSAVAWFRYRRVRHASLYALTFTSCVTVVGLVAAVYRHQRCSSQLFKSLENPRGLQKAMHEALNNKEFSEPADDNVTSDSRWEQIRRNSVSSQPSAWDIIRQKQARTKVDLNNQSRWNET